jgi:hypothetical protein
VFTRHAAAYSGDGAGALVARYYEITNADDNSLVLVASPAVNTIYKIEVAWTGSAFQFYVNGTSIGTIASPNLNGVIWRPSWGCQTTTAASRAASFDYVYHEVGQPVAR